MSLPEVDASTRRSRRLARRLRLVWPLALGIIVASCGDGDDDDDVAPPPTRIVVSPEAFLGRMACGNAEGAIRTYQATVFDVTDGYRRAFQLPSSAVVSCASAVTFEFVEPGRRYIARVAGFDRVDVSAIRPGVPIVVDESGESVAPRWTTTCLGYDHVDYGFSVGGAGGAGPENDGFGGFGGSLEDLRLGVTAYVNSAVTVRGCEPLAALDGSVTGLSVDITGALIGLGCGDGPGEVERFVVNLPEAAETPSPEASPAPEPEAPESTGGLGGGGGSVATGGSSSTGGSGQGGSGPSSPEATACGEIATFTGLTPGVQLSFTVEAYEAGQDAPGWGTTCRAYTVAGVIVPASCDPLVPFD